MSIQPFAETHLRELAKALADAATHRELTEILAQCGIREEGVGGSPKWERILLALSARQRQDGVGNNVGAFVQAVMSPVRFVGADERFNELRHSLNQILAFSGLTLGDDGRLRAVAPAQTLSEAQERAGRLLSPA